MFPFSTTDSTAAAQTLEKISTTSATLRHRPALVATLVALHEQRKTCPRPCALSAQPVFFIHVYWCVLVFLFLRHRPRVVLVCVCVCVTMPLAACMCMCACIHMHFIVGHFLFFLYFRARVVYYFLFTQLCYIYILNRNLRSRLKFSRAC